MRRLFTDCDILAYVGAGFELIHGFLGIDGDTIDYIGAERPAAAYDEVRALPGRLLMPGLVNCHGHTAMTLLRGVGSDLPLDRWLNEAIFPTEDRLTTEDYRAGYALAMMEMIASGTTSFTDMYMEPAELIKLNEQVGMKLSATRVVQSFDPNERAEDSTRIAEALALYEAYNGCQNGRVKIDFCVHAEYTCTDAVARGLSDRCQRYLPDGARMQIHISETKKEHEECLARHGMTPMAWAEHTGLLDLPTLAAHCIWIDNDDIDIMLRHGVTAVHNPSSNMKLGSGFAPVPKMLRKGLNVALGTDGCASNNNLNMFEEMHVAAVYHNGFHLDPVLMNAETVLRMATVNGAVAQGRPDTGCLAVGKKADVIAIDFRGKAHLCPVLDVPDLLVYSAQASDVSMTMVDGRILYEDGKFLTLDAEKVLADAKAAAVRLYGKG